MPVSKGVSLRKTLFSFVVAAILSAGLACVAGQQPAHPPQSTASSTQPAVRFAPVAPGEHIANLQTHFVFDQKVFDDWVNPASAQAIPGTLNIYNEAKKLGVTVFFLTGRPEDERDATVRNLKDQGFDSWQELIMREPGQSGSTATVYKSAARREIVKRGYRIVLNVGDQWSDLQGKPEAEYSVKYPNPYYFIK
jgi:phosphoglycolate phosphatase-like HAD superfamily hydrolase